MDVLIPPHPKIPLLLSGTSPFSPKFPIKAWSKRTPFRYNIPSSNFRKNPSFPIYLTSRNSRKFQVFANFGRPTSRRNSLRKKLVDYQQVRHKPSSDFEKPNLGSDDSGILKDDLNFGGAKGRDSDHGGGVDGAENGGREEFKSKRLGESVLWNKLENWVDQYKKDIEGWGIGTGPIFTVFEDLEGNVKWVSVDEHEILRRSRVDRRELEDSAEVNLKILRAESLVRAMESGKNVIPRNSSVAKFVVQGDSDFYSSA